MGTYADTFGHTGDNVDRHGIRFKSDGRRILSVMLIRSRCGKLLICVSRATPQLRPSKTQASS